MPIVDKRDRGNWYNSIRVNRDPWKFFSADKLKGNEIECGSEVLAKIPNIPGKISRKNVKSGDYVTHYITFVTERVYDPEKHQNRNKKVIIGVDISHIYDGMMIVNDRYYDFFDHDGKLIWRGEEEEKNETAVTTETEEVEDVEDGGDGDDGEVGDGNVGDSSLVSQSETAKTVPLCPRENVDLFPEEEDSDEEILEELEQERREKDRLEFLSNVLSMYREEVEEQARKRPEAEMTPYQIQRINELLQELKDFFGKYDIEGYLKLVGEMEGEDSGDRTVPLSSLPGDVMMVLAAYRCCLSSHRMGRLWEKDWNEETS